MPASGCAHNTGPSVHLRGLTWSKVTNTAQLATVIQTTAHYGEFLMLIFTDDLTRIEHGPWRKSFGFRSLLHCSILNISCIIAWHHSTGLIPPVYNLVIYLWKDYPSKLKKCLDSIFHVQMSNTDQDAETRQHFYVKWTLSHKICTHCC